MTAISRRGARNHNRLRNNITPVSAVSLPIASGELHTAVTLPAAALSTELLLLRVVRDDLLASPGRHAAAQPLTAATLVAVIVLPTYPGNY